MGPMMFYVHAQMVMFSEHTKDVLLFYAHAYWVVNFLWNTLKGQPLEMPLPPSLWLRYVDGPFVIQQKEHKQNIMEHINNVDPAIKFTVEDNQQDGAIQFLDTVVKPVADNTLFLTVYRKLMHTDQYFQWDSHHNLVAKYSVISTLTLRVRTVCTKPELLNQEINTSEKPLWNVSTLSGL